MKWLTKNKINKLLGILGILLINITAIAQDYIIPNNGQIIVNISDKGVNRIAIENDRIAQVIGNEDEYIIESDANLGQIFLTSSLKDLQEISVRFLTEREKIIDAKLIVKQIEPQTIIFKYKSDISESVSQGSSVPGSTIGGKSHTSLVKLPSEYKTSSNANNDKQHVIETIKLVYNNQIQGTSLPNLSCLKNNPKTKSLKLVQATQYLLKKQTVIKAVVSNANKNNMLFEPQDFSNCMTSVTAVALNSNQLAPKETTTIYMVGHNGK